MKNPALIRTIMTVFSILISLAVIVLAVLQIAEIWNGAINVLVPLLGLNLLCQTYREWEKHRRVAYFSLGTAIFVIICSIIVFFVK